jgi:hypothetical protein
MQSFLCLDIKVKVKYTKTKENSYCQRKGKELAGVGECEGVG